MAITQEQADRIEAKLDEMLQFRDQIMVLAGPFLAKNPLAKALLKAGKVRAGS